MSEPSLLFDFPATGILWCLLCGREDNRVRIVRVCGQEMPLCPDCLRAARKNVNVEDLEESHAR